MAIPLQLRDETAPISNGIYNAATQIANGHAFDKHIADWADLGICDKEGLADHLANVMANAGPRNGFVNNDGTFEFIDDLTGTNIYYNPNQGDGGTAYIPSLRP